MVFAFFWLARPTESETKLFKDGPKSARIRNEAEADCVVNGTQWKPNEKIETYVKPDHAREGHKLVAIRSNRIPRARRAQRRAITARSSFTQ